MDIASLLGPVLALGAILAGFWIDGGHLEAVWQPTAALIVFGGSLGAMFVAMPLEDVVQAFRALGQWLGKPAERPRDILDQIVDLAVTARKDSILALEKRRGALQSDFLRRAVRMAVDGVDPMIIRDSLEMENRVITEEQEAGAKFWEDLGGICPTVGILGAVLGLIHVMGGLDSGGKDIGQGIAIAFVATLYGVGAANILFIPIGKSLKRKALREAQSREMVIIGIEAILTGLNPKLIEDKLTVFCEPLALQEAA